MLEGLRKRQAEKKTKRAAAAYLRGYEHAAGRLLSQGLSCVDELAAKSHSAFPQSAEADQFDSGVVVAIRDFERLLNDAKACSHNA